MVAALQIRIDQAGKTPGVPGQAREDLALGIAATATAVGGPFFQYLWTIAWKPIDVVAGMRSSAALSSGTLNATLIQPLDIPGTFRIGLAVDAGFGLGARLEDVAFITFYAGPTLSADPRKRPRRYPAVGETTEHNVPDAIDPTGNVDGWARERQRIDIANEFTYAVGVVGAAPHATFPYGTGTLNLGNARVLLRNSGPSSLDLNGLDLWEGGALTSNDANFLELLIQTANLDFTGAATVADITTKTIVSGGTGDWVSGARFPVVGPFSVPPGQILYVTPTITGAPPDTADFDLVGY